MALIFHDREIGLETHRLGDGLDGVGYRGAHLPAVRVGGKNLSDALASDRMGINDQYASGAHSGRNRAD